MNKASNDRISVSIPSYHSSSPLSSQFSRGNLTFSNEDVSFPSYHQSHSQSMLIDDASETGTPTANPASIMMSSTIGDEDGYDDNMDEGHSIKKKTRSRNAQSRRKRITTSASVIIDDRFLDEPNHLEKGAFASSSTFEEQLILRVPSHIADQISNGKLSTDQLEFKFHDERHGTMKVNNQGTYETFNTILVDLPCIIETHKACKERKTWYKVADVCQMLIACDVSDFKVVDAYTKASSYSWPHGLTPPMRNVREKRFRKTVSQVSRESLEQVESIVEKLIEADRNAKNVEYELRDASAQTSLEHPEESFSTIEDGDLSDDSDLAAEIEYGLLEEKQTEQSSSQHGIASFEDESTLPIESSTETFTDFSFLQKSLSARLKRVKDNTKQQGKKPPISSQESERTEISSDIIMLFEDIESTK